MTESLVVTLGDPHHPILEVLGGKGASLARLVERGVAVPVTAVVTTEAYRRAVSASSLGSVVMEARSAPDEALVAADVIDAAFLAADIPADVEDAIVAYAEGLRPVALAVRSSATAEDLRTVSFAGQYRSSLDVVGGEAAVRAVRLTWASLWHPNAVAYRRTWGIDDGRIAMAVVLMEMVPARQAGVVFTFDPGGESGACRVEAVEGLGEELVSGRATPTVWLIPRDAVGDADAPPWVRAAATAALDIETTERLPQDVEWAWDGDTLWIVQARPITTLLGDGFDSPPDDHELTTSGIAEMVPGVLPPLVWEVNAFLLEEAFRRTLADAGACPSVDHPLLRRVAGRAVLDFDVLRASAEVLGPGAGEELERRYFNTVLDDGGSAVPRRRARRQLRKQMRATASRRRALDDAETLIAAVEAFDGGEPDLTVQTDDWLLAYRRRIVDLGARAMSAELAVAAVAISAYDRLERWLTGYLDEPAAVHAAQQLTAGAGLHSPAPANASRAVFGGPRWAEASDRGELALNGAGPSDDDDVPDDARVDVDRASEDAVEAQLASTPRWRHTRPLAFGIIDLRVHMLRRLAEDATHCLRERERTKGAVLTVGGELWRVHRELGERLVHRGIVATPDDVELLAVDELERALAAGRIAPALLAQRRRWLDRAAARAPLPVRFRGTPLEPSAPPGVGAGPAAVTMSGLGASAGMHTGTARAVVDPGRADALASGDILVAVSTDASWLPVFLRAGAIVVERGGPLSHAAIVARELGIPAVLNVADASTILDGATVTVDGDRGVVTVHESTSPERPS